VITKRCRVNLNRESPYTSNSQAFQTVTKSHTLVCASSNNKQSLERLLWLTIYHNYQELKMKTKSFARSSEMFERIHNQIIHQYVSPRYLRSRVITAYSFLL
jgi:DNA polymerase sigma